MKHSRTLLLIGLVSAIPGATVAEATAGGDKEAAAKSEKRCLSLSRIRNTRVLDDQSILFVMRGKPDYRNVLPRRCPGLGFYKSFGYKTGINSVCDLDIITVLESGRRGASCGLGKFVEYDPAEEDAAKTADTEKAGESEDPAL